MESTMSLKHSRLALVLLSLSLCGCKLGSAQIGIGGTGTNGNVPQTGVVGSGINGNLPQTGVAGINGNVPQTGAAGTGIGYLPQPGAGVGNVPQIGYEGDDPVQIAEKALLCFSDKSIYSSCDEAYRLTQSGNLNVPPDYTDQYCSGPCLSETHRLLNCLNGVLSHFLFYNRASIANVQETIKEGCSYGPKRGDFNVAEHIQEYNSAYKSSSSLLFGLILLFMVRIILF